MTEPKTDCFAFAGVRKCLALKEMACLGGECSFYKTQYQAEKESAAARERLKAKGLEAAYLNYHKERCV